MKFTIIPRSGVVAVDGIGYPDIPMGNLDPTIHAVQWYETYGEVERPAIGSSPPTNSRFTNYAPFQSILDAWATAHAIATAPPPEPTQAEKIAVAVMTIDRDVDAIMAAAVGHRAKEYEFREAEARAFKAGGYAGDAGPYLMDHISTSGLSPIAAADNVIAQADAWLGALKLMSTNRLAAKAGVRSGAIDATMASWGGFVSQIRTALGLS